ncbi:MAG: amino acid transporter [Herpetosiphonaceae bacterium]|nr:amino acid transporter [Herpetosiphonaceae bacterium]
MRSWLLQGAAQAVEGPYKSDDHHHQHPWWQVMCLTGVDYFSTLGYQPGIAFVAAGILSPIATLILVIFTLVGALPIYRRVSRESPFGQGSISMLERLMTRWKSKLFVLCLLGFAATDFIITITLSAADAAAHVTENPFVPEVLRHQNVGLTLLLVAVLGAVFLRGFTEAIGLAVVLVIGYLVLNCVVIGVGLVHLMSNPHIVGTWKNALFAAHGNPLAMLGVGLLLFPRLALGLSGFETGVAVMPLVRGAPGDTPDQPTGRIRNTHKLLGTAALLMSVYLITSSFVTTLLIPAQEFRDATATQAAGAANGRALAYLAHTYLGNGFGTVYDISTILILWFAGASAMAGLLNLVPRYLPQYGMAPKWTSSQRPLVLVFTAIAFLVTIVFRANVNAQGGAYATGVLVLMSSASVAVTLSARRQRRALATGLFGLITLAFFYITVANVIERPNGIKIASLFIMSIIITSLLSRVVRATEIRMSDVVLDAEAERMIAEAIHKNRLHLVMHNAADGTTIDAYRIREAKTRRRHYIPGGDPLLLVEVRLSDPSAFSDQLCVTGETVGPYDVLRCSSPAVPNAIAALALYILKKHHCQVHLNFSWTIGNPIIHHIRFLLWGEGDTARLVRFELEGYVPKDSDIFVHVA